MIKHLRVHARMEQRISHSATGTEECGAESAAVVQPGTVVLISGDLGAGKTQWVRGFARGLGCSARVHSPTFAIVNVYSGGRLPLAHLDLYRLETPEQILGAGVEEFLCPEGVALIEWGERLLLEGAGGSAPILGANRQPVRLARLHIQVMDETTRRLFYEAPGP